MMYRRLFLFACCLILINVWGLTASLAGDDLYTIAEELAHDERFTTMNALVTRFEALETLLNDPSGEFTLFAPVDGAWRYTDPEGVEVDLLSAIDHPASAEALLRYYIVPTNVSLMGYSSFYLYEYGTMLPGYSINVMYEDDEMSGRLLFNGVSFSTDWGPPVKNGSIVVLDSALPISSFSEMGRIYQTPTRAASALAALTLEGNDENDSSVIDVLTEAGDFTILLQLLESFPQIIQRLDGGGLYTLIAPTDGALVNSGWYSMIAPHMSDLSEESFALLFLERHIVPGYFDMPSFRRLVGQEGREIRLQTLDFYGGAALTAVSATGTVDHVLRVNGAQISQQPMRA